MMAKRAHKHRRMACPDYTDRLLKARAVWRILAIVFSFLAVLLSFFWIGSSNVAEGCVWAIAVGSACSAWLLYVGSI